MREVRLRRLGVVLDRADAAAERNPDDHRDRHPALRPVVHLRDLGDDLVVGGVDEAVELDLAHRAVAADREADRGADDAGLGERGVDHALFAEVLLQAVGDAEDAAELADVLTHDDDLVVGLQGAAQASGDALAASVVVIGGSPSERGLVGGELLRCSSSSGGPRVDVVEDRQRLRVGHREDPFAQFQSCDGGGFVADRRRTRRRDAPRVEEAGASA